MIGLRTFRKSNISSRLSDALGDLYSEHELRVIDRNSTVATFEPGETFVTEGANGYEALLILEGTAAVSRGGDQIATSGRGDIVGELSVLFNQPRNATVMATTPLTAVVFSGREFRTVLDFCPRLDQKVRELAAFHRAA